MTEIEQGILDPRALDESDARRTVARLFKTHARRLRHFLDHKLRNREDAQDASQEVFLKLWRQESAGNLKDEATSYMYSAAHSVAIDWERRRQSRGGDKVAEKVELDEIAHRDVPADEVQHWRDGVARLVSSLQELPERTQQIFILYHFEGLSHVEVAGRLGISERSVERHMATALGHCKERLKDFL